MVTALCSSILKLICVSVVFGATFILKLYLLSYETQDIFFSKIKIYVAFIIRRASIF